MTVRDLEVELEYNGKGAPRKMPFVHVEKWRDQLVNGDTIQHD